MPDSEFIVNYIAGKQLKGSRLNSCFSTRPEANPCLLPPAMYFAKTAVCAD